jgi:methylenetetrahydrofolate reductase (NADPH)
LDDVVARLSGDAGVTHVLTIGGDVPRPAGPFDSSLQLIETGVFQRHGVRNIGVAFYAEGNPNIDDAAIEQALAAKLEYCRANALNPYLVGQFCFEAAPLVRRIRALRESGIDVPLRLGVAGPASRKTLWKYAIRCGIGNSIRALSAQTERMTQLLTRDTPEVLLAELVDALGDTHALGIEGVHFFTFGGVGETAGWIGTVLDRAVR